MTQEEKQLLLKDLCARLPYGVIMTNKTLKETYYPLDGNEWQQTYYDDEWDDIPYLRPMSSMTEDEMKEYKSLCLLVPFNYDSDLSKYDYFAADTLKSFDWLNAHHFDYRTIYDEDKKKYMSMIEKGLAIAVTEENNPYEN